MPHLEELLDSGTITEAEYVFLADSALGEEIDKACEKDPRRYRSISANLYLKLGGERLSKLYRSPKEFHKLFEEGASGGLLRPNQSNPK